MNLSNPIFRTIKTFTDNLNYYEKAVSSGMFIGEGEGEKRSVKRLSIYINFFLN